ncbi:MAG: hypothetical protein E7641_02640 [Ruminococcaceae bacterium]|nr:hypothetical protein [Oscillospiraceae bacterium]
MVDLIISIVFAVCALIALLWGMNKGRKYRMVLSISRIIVVVVSTVLAVLASRLTATLLGKLFSTIIMDMIQSNSSTRELWLLLESVPSAKAVICALIAMIIAPLLFFAFFLAIKVALNRTTALIGRGLMKLGKTVSVAVFEEDEIDANMKKRHRRYREFKSPKKFDPVGALCGAICGFVVFFVIVIPAICPFGPINNIVQAATGLAKDEPAMQAVSEVSDALANNFATKTVRALGGDLIYDGLTTQKINGEKTNLRNETEFVGAIGKAISAASDKELDAKARAEEIKAIPEALDDTAIIPVLASEVLSAASDSWSQGKDFNGMEAPSVGKELDPVVQDLMGIMKDSDPEKFKSDVKTVVNVVAIMVEEDALSAMDGDDGALALFENEALVSGIMLELLSSERLSPMVASFTNLGIGVFADTLEIPDNSEVMYELFTNRMFAAVTSDTNGLDPKEELAYYSEQIADVYDDYGIRLSAGVADCIAAAMINDTAGMGKNGFKAYMAKGVSSELGYSALEISSTGSADPLAVIKAIDEQTSANTSKEALAATVKTELGRVMRCSDAQLTEIAESVAEKLYADLSADKLTYKNASVANASDLATKSIRITSDKLNVTMGNITDKEKESKALANVFASAIAIVDDVAESGDAIEGVIVSFGPLLDAFADCQMIGDDSTAELLTAILQSDKVRSNIGFSLIQATDMAGTVNNSAKTDGTYVALMKSLGSTVKVIRLTSEKEDTSEAVTELMKDITPASAEALKQLATPETVKNYGVPEESADKVSNMFSDMFGNMADAKESGMSDEEYAKESAAVSDMMSIAMTAGNSSDSNVFGEDSATGVTATEYLDRATESTVISNTLVNTVYGESEEAAEDPLALGIELKESEKTELVEAMDAKWKAQLESSNDEAANAEYQKVLSSVAAVVNINVSFSSSGVTLQ